MAQAFLPAALAGTKLRRKFRPVRGAFALLAIAFDALALVLSAAITGLFSRGSPWRIETRS